ncbi:MAG: class A beta-lactamase-related serine hydrolase [Bacteroidetes bacterium]|nr:MAG: class A beta-lactamase-related serine hydrolase [Bacteroidota bacterium]
MKHRTEFQKGIFLFLLAIWILPGISFGQLENKERHHLDSLLNLLEDHDKFMGSVCVLQNGKLQYEKTVGFSRLNPKQKATNATRYRIGSISKMFTTTMIFMAIEEGKLKLDAPVKKFSPKVKNAEQITISDLMNHRSGIHNFTNDPNYFDYHTSLQTRKQMLELMEGLPSDFEPGTKASYSNSNYVLLTFVLEDLYGRPYASLLEEKIVRPLSLQSTYMGASELKVEECLSYQFMGDWEQEKVTDPSIPLGAGAIISTPENLTRFIEALFQGKLVKKESLDHMKELIDGYGRGMFAYQDLVHEGYGHTGGIDGFSSLLVYFPEQNRSIALCSNGGNYSNNEIVKRIVMACDGKVASLPEFQVASERLLEQCVGSYESDEIPLKIDIRRKNKTLLSQASGQPAVALDYVSGNQFEFDLAGASFTFDPDQGTFVLEQGGAKFHFKKKE